MKRYFIVDNTGFTDANTFATFERAAAYAKELSTHEAFADSHIWTVNSYDTRKKYILYEGHIKV